MGWLSEAFANAMATMGFGAVGSESKDCPLKKTALVVFVRNGATLDPVTGATVALVKTSPKPDSKPTETDTALAKFPATPHGAYIVQVSLPSSMKADEFEPIAEQTIDVPLGECVYLIVDILPKANLKVKVVCKDTDKEGKATETILDGVTIKIAGPETKTANTAVAPEGWAPFPKIKNGQYEASIESLGNHAEHYAPATRSKPVAVLAGETKELILEAVPSGWIEFLAVEDGTDPEKTIDGIRITAKLPGDKQDFKTTKDGGVARAEKLLRGTVDIVEVSSENDTWEVVSIS